MKEGHQTWNNVVMLTKGGRQRGMDAAFYSLANVYLSPWFGARTVSGLGFAPQMKGVEALDSGARFLSNTTIGVLGLMDAATPMGLPKYAEDLGQTLGHYGVGPGLAIYD